MRGTRLTAPPISETKTPVVEPPKSAPTGGKIFEKSAANNQKNDSPIFQSAAPAPPPKSSLEKFIGENLISFIGIAVLLLGVGIGAKYAIDRDLISPLLRIVIGYVFGFALLGFAFKLRDKYRNFSAVLLSGAMAIMYFITFFAYTLYGLINQPTTFVLMLIFTAFTVAAAIGYNRQVIAHVGLVGAYAIPFLLSNDTGNYVFLFAYTAIINIGILAISVKKYWQPLFYSSFVFTWLIYAAWFLTKYSAAEYFNLALIFATVFFLIFYLTFIAYKLVSEEKIHVENVALILANSFVFYGFGYAMLRGRNETENYLGLFTLANAAIHFIFAFAVSRLQKVSRDLIYLLAALILIFVTIAVPVQFKGNFVTLVWSAEALILFGIGRLKKISLFENYAYPLMILASVSLLNDWQNLYQQYFFSDAALAPFYNPYLAVGLFFVIAFGLIIFISRRKEYESNAPESVTQIVRFALPVVFLLALYNVFRLEIGNYYQMRGLQTIAQNYQNLDYSLKDKSLPVFNFLWQTNYTMLFLAALSLINIKKFKSAVFGFVNLFLNAAVLGFFVTAGLYLLSELRDSYLAQTDTEYFSRGLFHILIRYVCYIFAAALIYASYLDTKQEFVRRHISAKTLEVIFDFVFYAALWLISSAELFNLTGLFGYNAGDRLGLSILWGVFALALIGLGIYFNKKHLRVGALILFAVTLVKIFFYDLTDLDTISKTVVFVSLGIIMLIVSFLYNKYKHLIIDNG